MFKWKRARLGAAFYRVEYCGHLKEYKIKGFKGGEPVYNIRGPLAHVGEEYIPMSVEECESSFGTSSFGLEVMRENPAEWFVSLKKARSASRRRWAEEVNPNGDYRVARYFDDIFEVYVTDILSKKEAYAQAEQLNKGPRAYVCYRICMV